MNNDKSSTDKRLFLVLFITVAWFLGVDYFMTAMGWKTPPKEPPPAAKREADAAKGDDPEKAKLAAAGDEDQAKEKEKPEAVAPPAVMKAAEDPPVDPAELLLGSATDKTKGGYKLEVQLEQKGAGVASVRSSRFEAEFEEGKPRHRPLELLRNDSKAPRSLSMTLSFPDQRPAAPATEDDPAIAAGSVALDGMTWKVVPDKKGRLARPLPADAATEKDETGREVVFETTVGAPPITITKTFRLKKDADGFEMELTLASDKDQTVAYTLLGPHGIPIEGEWYTGTFRDVFFGEQDGKSVKITTKSSSEIVKNRAAPDKRMSLPLRYAGIENQYFAALVEPESAPEHPNVRFESESVPRVFHEKDIDPAAPHKADVGFEITSRPISVGPGVPATQTFKVFTGPKTFDALTPYGAQGLASYRKGGWFGIPFAPEVAGWISQLLDKIHDLTNWVARAFGRKEGNYGVSIILLTLLVRALMFPISRKQAISAKKMQDLQPYMKELQEKYKDDKERQTKETFALYKRHGVNPVGGCLPALIQLPIFVGLWQALNTSVHLRHATFLYIKDLAAPDMMFRLPFEVPYLGHFFNLLPFLVVALMLVQTKLFSPPATTPEAEMQQKMMKYMMVFMAFMFYRVPSGLGIYFITSSLWQISERLLLPKVLAKRGAPSDDKDKGPGRDGPFGDGEPPKPPGRIARLWGKMLEEARKDPTYRKVVESAKDGNGDRKPDQGRDRDRERGKPRSRPGRRR